MAKAKADDRTRVITILARMVTLVTKNSVYAERFKTHLEEMLDEMHNLDAFGTEGQHDPRGDFRNGQWSMDRIEGIDK